MRADFARKDCLQELITQGERRMRHLTIMLPAVTMLAACNSGPTVTAENASVAEVATAAQTAVKMQPGQWETTVKVASIEGTGLPPEVQNAMKQQKQEHKVQTCLTPEQAEKPPQEMLGAMKGCTYEKFSMAGGTMSGTMVCKNMPGMAGEIRSAMSGSFTSTSYDFTSETQMDMPAMPGGGGKMTTKTQISGKRLGDCERPTS